jgi:hypothetical protein
LGPTAEEAEEEAEEDEYGRLLDGEGAVLEVELGAGGG